MKNHEVNIAPNGNYPSSKQGNQTCEVQLVIVPLPENLERLADLKALEKIRSTSCEANELSCAQADGWEWLPTDGEEVANRMRVVPIESITEELYQRFSRLLLPLFGGLYGFFSGEKISPLDWVKRSSTNHLGVVQFWRHKKSDDKVSSVRNDHDRTILTGKAQTIEGSMAQVAVFKGLGISDEERRKLWAS